MLPLLLLPLGCSLCVKPRFQTASLAGDPAGLRKFEGEWFDEEGNLLAVVSSSPEPRLSVQTPYDLEPKDARLLNGEIVFRLTNDNPEEVSLRLTGEDELQVLAVKEPLGLIGTSGCSCAGYQIPVLVLIRNPSPAWHMKLTLRKGTEVAAELASAAYEGTLDRLARVL